MQKHVNLVDLVKSFPTNICLQNLASIQKRTSPIKFANLAEKSSNGSVSNLSTKVGGQVGFLEFAWLLEFAAVHAKRAGKRCDAAPSLRARLSRPPRVQAPAPAQGGEGARGGGEAAQGGGEAARGYV